jgi:hypothetical protein
MQITCNKATSCMVGMLIKCHNAVQMSQMLLLRRSAQAGRLRLRQQDGPLM